MKKVYVRKWLISIIMLISLSIFNLSCSLIESPEEEGYLSFVLPTAFESNYSRAPLLPLSSDIENPESYTVLLMIGKDDTYKGKFIEKRYKPGDSVVIKGLTVDSYYSLIIKAESKNFLYEGLTNAIKIQKGKNPITINLTKKNKSKVNFDFSLLNFEPSDTISYNVKDINDKIIFEEKDIPVNRTSYSIPYGFKTGTYKFSFTSSKSNIEKYYFDNEGVLKISKENMGTDISIIISSLPISRFYVSSSSINGNGTKDSPFNSLKYAIDKISSSTDASSNCEIIVNGEITDSSLIVIEAPISLIIKGNRESASPSSFIGNIIIDNPNANVTISNISLTCENGTALTYINGNLSLGTDTELSPFISSLVVSCDKTIDVKNALISTSETSSTLDTAFYKVGKKIFNSPNPDFIKQYQITNPSYYINNQGIINLKPTNTSELYVKIDGIPSNMNYKVSVTEASTNKQIYLDTLSYSGYLPCMLEIGKSYNVEITNSTGMASITGSKKEITINQDRTKNVYSMALINKLFVSDWGSDEANSGNTLESPLRTISKAMKLIDEKYKDKPDIGQITINVSGTICDGTIDVPNGYDIMLEGDTTTTNNQIISNFNVQSGAKLTLNNVKSTVADINGGTFVLTGKSSTTHIGHINYNGGKIEISCYLNNAKPIELVCTPETLGTKVVTYNSSYENQSRGFTLISNSHILGEDGTIKNPNVVLSSNLDSFADSTRYEYTFFDNAPQTNLLYKNTYKNEADFIPFEVPLGSEYIITVRDTSDYSNFVFAKKVNIVNGVNNIKLNINRVFCLSNDGDDTNVGTTARPFKTFSHLQSVIKEMQQEELDAYNLGYNIIPYYTIYISSTETNPYIQTEYWTFDGGKFILKGTSANCAIDLQRNIELKNNSSLEISNLIIKSTNGIIPPLFNIGTNCRLDILENVVDTACSASDEFIVDDGTLYIENIDSVPIGYIRKSANNQIILGDYFYTPGCETPRKIFISEVSKPSVGSPCITKLTQTNDIKDSVLFHVRQNSNLLANLLVGRNGKYINAKEINYKVINNTGDSNLMFDRFQIDLIDNYTQTAFNSDSLKETGSLYVNPDFNYTLNVIEKSSGDLFFTTQITSGTSTSSPIDIKIGTKL